MRHIDPSILRTRTCKYLVGILYKCIGQFKDTPKSKRLTDEIDYIKRTQEKQSKKYADRNGRRKH